MLFELNEEQRMVQDMVRDFARTEIEPKAAELDRNERFPKEILAKMGELGLLGMMIPPEYDGAGAGAVAYSLAMQEIAYSCASTAVTMSVNNLVCDPIHLFGTKAQKKRFLKPLARGEIIGAFAVTEPGSGSDAGSATTSAVQDGDDFVLNGTKSFITNAEFAGVTIVIARTAGLRGARGLSAFLVPAGTEGLIIGRREDKMGLRASNTVQLILEDCRIPASAMLARQGQGFKVAMVALDGGRVGIASQSVGIARACLDEAKAYGGERKQFGKALVNFQAIQWMIADMATEIEAAGLLTLKAAALKEAGRPFTREASMAKLFASEMVNRVAFKALQIHGGYGYSKEYKIERLYRDARVTTIYEGTSEVQRIVIARQELN